MRDHAWEEENFRVFDRFLDPEKSYLDIGAWIGSTVLYGAHKAKHVYAIEPDNVAFQELLGNLAVNPAISPKVTCINAALTEKPGKTRLYIRKELGDSMSSVIPTVSDKEFSEVRSITMSELISQYGLQDVNFVKMDIEAGEYRLIPAMGDYLSSLRPTLYVSLHFPYLLDEAKLEAQNPATTGDIRWLLEERPLVLTRQMLDCLRFYRFIYDAEGNEVSRDWIVANKKDGPFVFTDLPWRK